MTAHLETPESIPNSPRLLGTTRKIPRHYGDSVLTQGLDYARGQYHLAVAQELAPAQE